ncbi:MAG TPA: PAS domain S-box protein [Ktedonobacterales bacterium]|jgi:PAS domain S-box-containing protein
MQNECSPPNEHLGTGTTTYTDSTPSNAANTLFTLLRDLTFYLVGTSWKVLRRRLQVNSFSPRWLPESLRHPAIGYLAALLIQTIAILTVFFLFQPLPDFTFESLLPVLVVVVVALGWGTGPGLLATLLGAFFFYYLLFPRPFIWAFASNGDGMSILLFLLVGLVVSIVVGQSSWIRLRAVEMNGSLREEQARTERERLRLRTLFNTLPAAVGMVDAQGKFLEKTPACKALWGEGAPIPRDISDYEGARAWWPDTGQPLAVKDWALTRALKQGEVITRKEVEIETADGERKFVLDSASPIRDETGEVIGAVGILQDITERKRLEKALRKAEHESAARACQLEAVFEAMTDAVLVFDTNTRIVQRNAADRQLFAFDTEPETLAERRALVHLRDENRQPIPEERLATLRALKGELLTDPNVPDMLVRTTRGEDTLINVTAAPLRNGDGNVIGGIMVMRDITERRQLEREIGRRARELEVIFETIVDGVFVYDTDGHIVRTNSAGNRLLDIEAHPEICSLSVSERMSLFHPSFGYDGRSPESQWPPARMLRGEVLSDTDAVDVSYRMLDGRKVEASITGAPLRDDSGHIIGAVMMVRDMTERQRLERRTHEALQALLTMAEALVQVPAPEASPPAEEDIKPKSGPTAYRLAELVSNLLGCKNVSISAMDLEKGVACPLAVVGLSPEMEQRWWAGERRSARWMDGSHPEVLERLQAGEAQILTMDNPLLRDEPNPYKAQTILAVPMRIAERLVGLLILDPADEPRRYTAQDIALAEASAKLGALVVERERLLREREAAQASELALRQTNQQMDAFLGMASHELKTPVTTILLGLQLAQRRIQNLLRNEMAASDGAGKKLEALEEQLSRTNRQATRLDRLINDLLDVSRIQAEKLAFRLESVDLKTMIYEIAQEQRQANPQRHIQICLPAHQEVEVNGDVGRIEQVVMNYLTNALKYSPESEPVEIGATLEGNNVRVWVRDHGPGIPLAEQELVWKRFHRVEGVEVRSGSGVGLGLGLYISRAIIERHHGQIGVDSLPGEGATFWFTLPLPEKTGS